MSTGAASGAARRRPRRRQDLHDARRGPAPARRRPRRRRRASSRPTAARPRRRWSTASRSFRAAPSSTAAWASTRWTSTRCSPASPRSPSSTSSPTRTRPARAHAKRWQDVDELLDAGIDVISTVNIQHIESLNDVVLQITGVPQRETIPDAVLRAADQIEVVDLAPQALRDRLASGLVYPAERIDAALSNYFRLGNLTALRELALLWLADEVDTALKTYRAEHGIDRKWEARERVVVALTGGPEGETLLRRGARIASRASGGELFAVHVTHPDGLRARHPGRSRQPAHARRAARRHLPPGRRRGHPAGARRVRAGGGCHAARHRRQPSHHGSRRRSPGRASARPSSASRATSTCTSSPTRRRAQRFSLPKLGGALSRRRLIAGFVVALIAGPAAQLAARDLPHRGRRSRATCSRTSCSSSSSPSIGGIWPGAVRRGAVGALARLPLRRAAVHVTIADPLHLLALVLYVVIAAARELRRRPGRAPYARGAAGRRRVAAARDARRQRAAGRGRAAGAGHAHPRGVRPHAACACSSTANHASPTANPPATTARRT